MKKIFLMFALFVALCFTSCGGKKTEIVEQDLRFCESVLSYKDGMLIANFGGSELNPLNTDGMGYIKYYADGKMSDFIPTDGILSAPKGMMVIDNKLYIADVNKVVVYDIDNLTNKACVMALPESEMFVNHLHQIGNMVLVSVTNTGNIYSFDIDEKSMPIDSTLSIYTNVAGANGLLYDNSILYIASYPADGVTKPENQIYKITDLANPQPQAITDRPGHYDGLALDGDNLYFTDWQGGALGRMNLTQGTIEILNADMPFAGPAEIDIVGDKICVPDLVNSKVYMFTIEK